jgi:hypothetical protein
MSRTARLPEHSRLHQLHPELLFPYIARRNLKMTSKQLDAVHIAIPALGTLSTEAMNSI